MVELDLEPRKQLEAGGEVFEKLIEPWPRSMSDDAINQGSQALGLDPKD